MFMSNFANFSISRITNAGLAIVSPNTAFVFSETQHATLFFTCICIHKRSLIPSFSMWHISRLCTAVNCCSAHNMVSSCFCNIHNSIEICCLTGRCQHSGCHRPPDHKSSSDCVCRILESCIKISIIFKIKQFPICSLSHI